MLLYYWHDKINTVETISVSQSVVVTLLSPSQIRSLATSLGQPGVEVTLEVREVIKVLSVGGVGVQGHDAVLVILLLSHPVHGRLLAECLQAPSQFLRHVSISTRIINRFLPPKAGSSSKQSFSQVLSEEA